MLTYHFDADGLTDAGTTRPVNEDSCTILRHDALANSAVLLAVADGVGGLPEGENASAEAIRQLKAWWEGIDWPSMPTMDELFAELAPLAERVNQSILRLAREKGVKCGTTLSVLLLKDDSYRFFHVGDSRIYQLPVGLFGNLVQLTEDHTQKMPKQVEGAIMTKTYLTECLGYKERFRYQQGQGSLKTGELFLVCSDGAYKKHEEAQLGKMLRREKKRLDMACFDIIDRAKTKCETDNLTALAVRICK